MVYFRTGERARPRAPAAGSAGVCGGRCDLFSLSRTETPPVFEHHPSVFLLFFGSVLQRTRQITISLVLPG